MEFVQPDVKVDGDGGGGGGPCLMSGTRITTSDGSVCVENLSIGAMVLTASGESRPVRWLGHRELDCQRHANPAVIWPFCVRAGAFGESQPARDLWLSPGHAIFIEGVLIQVKLLANGITIFQVPRERVEYWHVELESHDILLTEGLPTESYLDLGNRTAFINGGAYVEAHPDFEPKNYADYCVPLVQEGPALERAKALLLARAQVLGHEITRDADVHLLVDGQRIEPLHLTPNRLAFTLPAGASTLELRSRSFIPAYMQPATQDMRSLGICVRRLQLDGADVSLEDDGMFALGWHKVEGNAESGRWRWSSERAPLPAEARLVVIDYGQGYYWAEPPSQLIALSA